MNFNRFKTIIMTIQEYDEKKEKINKFFEQEIMDGSYCMITVGDQIQSTLIAMLADEFNCWYSTTIKKPTYWWNNKQRYGISNEIEWWLYESDVKKIIVDEKEYEVNSIGSFYDYLIENYYRGLNETEFSDEVIPSVLEEDRLDIVKSLFNL